MKWRKLGMAAGALALFMATAVWTQEVPDKTHTRVVVRNHPQTGRPYVSVVPSEGSLPPDPLAGIAARYTRPDYRMLDPTAMAEEVSYDGPVSDRRKVYLFAASLMTVGAAGGAVGMATAPAAAGATSGAGAYAAAGSAVAGGMTAAGVLSTRVRPEDEDYRQRSEAVVRRLYQEMSDEEPKAVGEKKEEA